MKWTEPKSPSEGVSYYDHAILDTALGQFIIEWKSWKDRPSYDIIHKGNWLGSAMSLADAQRDTTGHIQDMTNSHIKCLIDLVEPGIDGSTVTAKLCLALLEKYNNGK